MLLLATALAAQGTALGVDYVPSGRADLIWVDEGRASGTLVGEFDGLVRPSLTPYLLVHGQRVSVAFSFGFARTAEINWTGEERRKVVNTALRPAMDVQRYLVQDKVSVWVGAGVHGVVPIVRDLSTAYGEAELEAAREANREVMARIGGVGARVGAGAEVELASGLSLGLRVHGNSWRGQRISEDSVSVSTLTWADAGLRMQVDLPQRDRP